MAKIVVLNGSPRKGGNTEIMLAAFVAEAKKLGHEVVHYDVAHMKLGGCHACETCYKSGKACSYDDDYNKMAPEIEGADGIVLAMPVYWYSIPAQIKCVIDKLYSLCVGKRHYQGKKCGIISCCEENDVTVMDGVRMPIERSCALLKWEVVGEVLVPGVLKAGEVKKTDGEKQAAELAKKF
mgnify:FL=1